MGPNLANMVDGPIPLSIFWPKTPRQRARHAQGYCHDARSKHQAKVQVFSDEQPHVTLPLCQITMLVHCLTLFKKLEVNNFHLSGEFSDVQFFRRLSHLPDPLQTFHATQTLNFFIASAP
jgi:hypothetical protein